MTVRVKICGITRVEDARAAIAAGADMIGLNFYAKSPRYVEIDRAREIRAAIGSRAVVVGVFVNAARAYIDERLRAAALDMIQFSGDEDDAALAGWPVPSIVAQPAEAGRSVERDAAPRGLRAASTPSMRNSTAALEAVSRWISFAGSI